MGVRERRFLGSVSRACIPSSLGLPCPAHWEGASGADRSQSVEPVLSLLAHRGEIAAEAAEDRGTGPRAKGSSNVLLDVHHPQIPLGLIVRQGQRQVIGKGQHLL